MFKLFRKFSKKESLLIVCSILFVAFHVGIELKIPDFMSEITVLIQTEGTEIEDVLKQGALMMGCALFSVTLSVIVGYLAALLSASFSRKLRHDIFEKVSKFSMNEIKKFSTSSLITRTTNDVTQVEMFIAMGLQALVKAPIMAFWAVSKILDKSIEWSMLTGGCVVILLTTVAILMIIVLPRFEKVQRLIDKVNGVTRENVTGIRVIRAFNAEKYQEGRFEDVNRDLTNMQLFNQRCFSVMSPMMYIVMHFLTLGIYLIGAILINGAGMMEKMTLFGNMVVFTSYGMHVIMSFLMLAVLFMMWPRVQVSSKRINEVLDQEVLITDGNLDSDDVHEEGTIEFRNVSFKYPDADEYVLKNISFKVNKGETIAFIGSTGSGKSTLINLVPRFYDVTEGSVLIDGVNVKDYKLETLYNKLGYVPQKAVMFTGTISSNVSYGNNGKKKANKEKIKQAIEVAQGTDFVSKMEKTYDSHIARGGTNVSGGQKQRLSIARAIARDPEIYIFDDSFSALDYKTDAVLRKELKKYTKDATCMIVAQRIGTIMNADKIVVLDKGECVGIGTHHELLKKCKVYKEIALSQLSKEELNNG